MTHISSRKKVAICFSGLVRTYQETYQNFLDALILANPGYDFDVFISTWTIQHSNNSTERVRRLAWYGENTPPFVENLVDIPDVTAKYQPVSLLVEKPFNFDTSWFGVDPAVQMSFNSMLLMTYKIKSAFGLLQNFVSATGCQYDFVIRMRFDSLFPFPIILDSCDPNELLVPSMMQPKPSEHDWVNDKFAVGSYDLLSKYCNWYDSFTELVGIYGLQPETTLAAHLKRHGVPIRCFGTEMELIRHQ